MLISLALLAPIVAVLYWIYARTLKRPLNITDYVVLSLIVVIMTAGTVITHVLVKGGSGDLWVYVLAPMVGYGLLLLGLGLAFWLRKK